MQTTLSYVCVGLTADGAAKSNANWNHCFLQQEALAAKDNGASDSWNFKKDSKVVNNIKQVKGNLTPLHI